MSTIVPISNTYPPYFQGYINLVEANSIHEAIEKYSFQISNFFGGINENKADYSYAEGKWSLKEMLQHIIDTERIFAYRVVSLARGEKNPLPGFDENEYAANSEANNREWKSLLNEFYACRTSTDLLLKSLSPNQLSQSGITNGKPNTTVAIGFVIFGHILHHINIIKDRYL